MKKEETASETESILLFDGDCHFCNASVRFIIRRDPSARFRFASLQSDIGQRLLREAGVAGGGVSSVILIDNGRPFMKSSAVLRVVRRLKGLWPLLYGLVVVPLPVRDRVYDWVARNRYRWFGRSDHCRLPTATERSRFLDI